VYGTWHVSTSPAETRAEGRLARLSLSVDGRLVEVLERLEPGTFRSKSITPSLEDGEIVIDAPDVRGVIHATPRSPIADFGDEMVVGGPPLSHYIAAVDVAGVLELAGQKVEFNGQGCRDRTWGFRDESLGLREWIWCFAVFPRFSICWMRIVYLTDNRTQGRHIQGGAIQRVTGLGDIVRDPSGLFLEGSVRLEDGDEIRMRTVGKSTGFWVPMSPYWERIGPTMSAYDQFCRVRTDAGDEGAAVVEHAQLREIF
jgi:hypothetical protein